MYRFISLTEMFSLCVTYLHRRVSIATSKALARLTSVSTFKLTLPSSIFDICFTEICESSANFSYVKPLVPQHMRIFLPNSV